MKTVLIYCFLIASFIIGLTTTLAQEQVDNDFNHAGGIAEILINKKSTDLPDIKFGIHQPTIIDEKSHWRVLIGLDLETIPGEYLIYLKRKVNDATSEHIKFFIEQKKQTIETIDKKLARDVKKTHSDLSLLDFENTQQPNLPLKLPVSGDWNLNFGTIYYHSKKKTSEIQNLIALEIENIVSIRSPENAIISNIISNDADGSSTVFLDHGRGLFSIIDGITDLNVEIGNGVLSGAVIGKVTPITDSRKESVIAKRLTWQCVLNGTYVNPIFLTQL